MDNVSPQVLDFWQAFDAVEPIGEQRLQSARIETALNRVVEYIAAGNGYAMEPTSIEDNMPYRYKRERKQKVASKPTDTATDFQRMASAFGLTEIVEKHGRGNKSS